MRQPATDVRRATRRLRRRGLPLLATLLLLLVAGCSSGARNTGLADPGSTVSPSPNYLQTCAPMGADTSSTCLRVTLSAIDAARAKEGLAPMRLPAGFARLSVPEQLFVAVDRERVDRGLRPFTGLSDALDSVATRGATTARLPPRPGRAYSAVDAEWIGAVANGLDADFQWMYDDGPGSGVPGCDRSGQRGCWVDRQILLDRLGPGHLVMGAAFDPTGDSGAGDRGGPSLAATLAVSGSAGGPYAYTWAEATKATAASTLEPLRAVPTNESNTGVPDPTHNVPPQPDFTLACSSNGLDDSATCLGAILAAVNHARALEGVRPMVLPAGFGQLSVPDQLLVAIDLERVDRGLAPFVGLTSTLNANAQKGADDANDPPDPGRAYLLDDTEWAGGSDNGLDAVYGWMYDDGFDSGNLDCLHRGAAGCWGHRKGILDNFGSGSWLVMGAALNASGDTHSGDDRGTSMAVTLAVAHVPPRSFTYTWAQVVAALAGPSA